MSLEIYAANLYYQAEQITSRADATSSFVYGGLVLAAAIGGLAVRRLWKRNSSTELSRRERERLEFSKLWDEIIRQEASRKKGE
jgi:hypothetical protein